MRFFSKKEKIRVKAVHEKDFDKYLKSLGVYDAIVQGKAKCQFCGEIITLESLQAVVPCDDEICFVCQNPKCINQLAYDK